MLSARPPDSLEVSEDVVPGCSMHCARPVYFHFGLKVFSNEQSRWGTSSSFPLLCLVLSEAAAAAAAAVVPNLNVFLGDLRISWTLSVQETERGS